MDSDSSKSVKFHKSKASKLWILVLLLVLAILFFETSITKQVGYNVIIITDSNMVGKAVYVDNRIAGQVKENTELGTNTGTIHLELKDGTYKLELKDSDKTVLLTKDINIKGKALIDLKKNASPE